MEPKEARGIKRDPKRLPSSSHFSQNGLIFVTPASDGPGRWPQGATACQNDPTMLQKKMPGRHPQKRHSKKRRQPPAANTSSIHQVLEESAAEAVACKSAALFKVKSYAGVSGRLLVEDHSSTSTVCTSTVSVQSHLKVTLWSIFGSFWEAVAPRGHLPGPSGA